MDSSRLTLIQFLFLAFGINIGFCSKSNKNLNEKTYTGYGMRKRYVLAIGLAVIIIAATVIVLASTRPTNTEPTPTIMIEPASNRVVATNYTFTVNVYVENCADIYAVQVDIRYDPQVLNATSVSEGTFLNSTGTTSVLFAQSSLVANSTPPRAVVYFVDTKLGNGTGPDSGGNGTLFTITFQVISTGSTQLQFFPYNPGTGSPLGTYFLKRDKTEVIPAPHDGSYG
jgi:hypothetical protein